MAHTKHTVTINDEPVEYWRIDNDINGNGRYLVHYLAVPFDEYTGSSIFDYRGHQLAHQAHAAKALGGTKYRGKWFGGGIVFASYNVEHDLKEAINTNKGK